MHVRSLPEVVAAAEVDVAQRLEVRDRTRPHAGALCRREAEEQLGRVGDQVGARDLRGLRHLLRQGLAAFEAATREAAANRRHVEELRVANALRRILDVVTRVGAQEEDDVVLLEPRVAGIAREALGVDQHRLACAAVVRQVTPCCIGDELVEVRLPPRDGHAEAGRRRRVVGIESREHALELGARRGQVAATDRNARRHDLVVQGRHQHLDPVRAHDADAFEQMLLGQLLRRRGALR